MIRFTDIVPETRPKKAPAPQREPEPAFPLEANASDAPKPAKTPRKKKSA